MATKWRFLSPLNQTCRVVFAGRHFQAGLLYTRKVLKERDIDASQIELIPALTTQELLNVAPHAHVAIPFMECFDQHFYASTSNKLRLIMQYGVGLEGVDMEEATRRGVAVSNIPAANTGNAEATAEHALLLTMSLLRPHLQKRFQAGELGGLPIPRTLHQKNVAVVGFGAVGSTLCRYLVTLGANVTAIRRQWPLTTPNNDDLLPIQRETLLHQALPTTDVLILACTMTPETHHLINRETIQLLPKGALIVNVGRGPLVEYSAVLEALESEAIGGFASDVGVGHPSKPSEPWDFNDVLSMHPNTLFTPHVGGYCDLSYCKMAEAVVDAIENVVRGEPPPVWVNGT